MCVCVYVCVCVCIHAGWKISLATKPTRINCRQGQPLGGVREGKFPSQHPTLPPPYHSPLSPPCLPSPHLPRGLRARSWDWGGREAAPVPPPPLPTPPPHGTIAPKPPPPPGPPEHQPGPILPPPAPPGGVGGGGGMLCTLPPAHVVEALTKELVQVLPSPTHIHLNTHTHTFTHTHTYTHTHIHRYPPGASLPSIHLRSNSILLTLLHSQAARDAPNAAHFTTLSAHFTTLSAHFTTLSAHFTTLFYSLYYTLRRREMRRMQRCWQQERLRLEA